MIAFFGGITGLIILGTAVYYVATSFHAIKPEPAPITTWLERIRSRPTGAAPVTIVGRVTDAATFRDPVTDEPICWAYFKIGLWSGGYNGHRKYQGLGRKALGEALRVTDGTGTAEVRPSEQYLQSGIGSYRHHWKNAAEVPVSVRRWLVEEGHELPPDLLELTISGDMLRPGDDVWVSGTGQVEELMSAKAGYRGGREEMLVVAEETAEAEDGQKGLTQVRMGRGTDTRFYRHRRREGLIYLASAGAFLTVAGGCLALDIWLFWH